jgi:PAS domain S-box-containing protein
MRILIADDHELVRKGVRSVLTARPDFDVCGEAIDGQDAVAQTRLLCPDLVVMDISMPRLNGLEATREIRRILPQVDVLVLSQHDSPEMMRQAVNAGARGYVVKSAISENLIAGIDNVRYGRLFFDAAVSQGRDKNLDSQEILQRSEAFERALRESEERFRQTFEQAAVGIAHVAEDGRWLRVNQKFCEIVGYTQEELRKLTFQAITHPTDLEADLAHVRKMIRGELDQYSMEKRYIRKDGQLVWINLTVAAVREVDYRLKYFVSVVEDISARKTAEVLLRQSDERLRALAEFQAAVTTNMVEGLYTLDSHGLVTSINPAAESMLGWTSGELLGKKMHDMTHHKHPDGSPFPASECPGLLAVQNGEQLREHEDVFIRKDGSCMPVVFSASPLRKDGEVIGIVVGFRDDEEPRRIRSALRESERQLRQIIDALPAAVYTTDANGVLTHFNPAAAEFSGRAPKLGVDRWCMTWKLFRADGSPLPHEECPMAVALKDGRVLRDVELIAERPDGTRRWCIPYPRLLRDGNGKIIGGINMLVDITERKQAAKSLAEVARQQQALFELADQSHRAGSMDEIYRAALDAVTTALRCDRASVLLCDRSGAMRFVSSRGLSEGYRKAVDGHSVWDLGEKEPRPLCISDVERSELPEALRAAISAEGIRAIAFIPLVSNGGLTGKFMASFNAPHPFSEAEIELSLTIARQLAFAIERKRAEESLRRSEVRLAEEAEALTKLNAWSARLWRARALEEGLDEMLGAVIELLGSDKANIQLLDAGRGVLTIAAQRGFEQAFLDFFREVSAEENTACGRALRLCRPVIVEDVETDALFTPFRAVARAAGYRAVVSVPMIGSDGTPIGMLSAHFASPHCPSDQDLRRLELYVHHASDFVRRCRTEEALQRRDERFRLLTENLDAEVRSRTQELEMRTLEVLQQSEQLRDLSARLLRAQDDERRRVARELHDSAGQTLTVLGLDLGSVSKRLSNDPARAAQGVERCQKLVSQLSEEIRTMSYLLHPPLLDETGLTDALRWYVQGLRERSALQIDLEVSPDFGRLSAATELVIFRVVQEALTNVHRHSRSKTATIRLRRDDTAVSVEIQDDGRGISPAKLAELHLHGSGVGIRGMRERIRQFSGTMKIESNGTGTRINVTFPVSECSRVDDSDRVRTYCAAAEDQGETSSSRLRILVADDSPPVRNAIVALLSRDASWQVCGEAANGEQALEKARESRPDVILLDINMPDVSGLDVARCLRSEMPEAVIFIMSQNDANLFSPGAIAAGASGCLDKSNLASDLVHCLQTEQEKKRSQLRKAAVEPANAE